MAGELPEPDSPELESFGLTTAARAIYRVLHEHRGRPLTMPQIRELVGPAFGSHEQLGRRRRELHLAFDILAERVGSTTTYELIGLKPNAKPQQPPISLKTRAQVLQAGFCAMCGRTPTEDRVKLVVDHKIPEAWGGTNDLENLQALCEDCNQGKKDFFQTFAGFGDVISMAIEYDEPHQRIGELLKAFDGKWVPSDLLGIVASAKQYQEDWQKRLRELRTLGWVIISEKRYDEGVRVRAYYRVQKAEPWPEGNIRSEITRRERERRGRKQQPD